MELCYASKLRFSLVIILVLLFQHLDILDIMIDSSVVDLDVAHGHQRRHQRLHDVGPGLQHREAVGRGLQGGEAAGRGLGPHDVLARGRHGHVNLPQSLQRRILAENIG